MVHAKGYRISGQFTGKRDDLFWRIIYIYEMVHAKGYRISGQFLCHFSYFELTTVDLTDMT